MIVYTKDEYAIYKKVKLALLQEDICTLVSNHILDAQKIAKKRPDTDYETEIMAYKKFYNKISSIGEFEDMDMYEKETEEAFWDPDLFEHIISNLVYEQEQEQEKENE